MFANMRVTTSTMWRNDAGESSGGSLGGRIWGGGSPIVNSGLVMVAAPAVIGPPSSIFTGRMGIDSCPLLDMRTI